MEYKKVKKLRLICNTLYKFFLPISIGGEFVFLSNHLQPHPFTPYACLVPTPYGEVTSGYEREINLHVRAPYKALL